jgi:putative transposase
VLSWRVSNTLDVSFCIEALEEAIEHHGAPEIFNTDQGRQFTSDAFTGVLKAHDIRIRWMAGAVLTEHLFQLLQYREAASAPRSADAG